MKSTGLKQSELGDSVLVEILLLDRRVPMALRAIIVVLILFPMFAPCVAQSINSDQLALSSIFSEQHVDSSAFDVRRRAIGMSAEDRYRFLSDWILPGSNHDTLRIQIAFSQTNPPPAVSHGGVTQSDTTDIQRMQTGGQLVSPVIDFVDTARQLGRLDELQLLISEGESAEKAEGLAITMLIALAQEDFDVATDAINEIYKLTNEGSTSGVERGPEAIAMWVGTQFPETYDIARDLTFLVYEQTRHSEAPRSERWHRQVYSLKHTLKSHGDSQAAVARNSLPDVPLRNWSSVSRMTAETCGKGYPLSNWQTRSGQVHHSACHDHDYFYYAIPLSGNFEIEADLSTFDYRDIHLAVGSRWAGPGYDLKSCLNGNFRKENSSIPIAPPLTTMSDWMRVRVIVKDGLRTTFVNGRNVFQSPYPSESDPWIAIHSPWYSNGTVRNLRVSGDPAIPRELKLATQTELPGWLSWYNESVGGSESVWSLQPISTAIDTRGSASSDMTTASDSRVLVGHRDSSLPGSHQESLLSYHRPMLEDGLIEYDFFYSPGKFDVHPALGRLVFLLKPEGIKEHWVTDGKYDQSGLDPMNETLEPENRRGSQSLPLKSNGWNQIQLKLTGDKVQLRLNAQLVYERELEATNQRSFGLFHYADQSEARVRNIHWQGEWPQQLPETSEQELADDKVERLLATSDKMTAEFQHDFSSGLPPMTFYVSGTGWEDGFTEQPSGVKLSRPGADGYHRSVIVPQLQLSGDFDMIVEFEQLETSVTGQGNAGIHLLVGFDNQFQDECRLLRKLDRFASNEPAKQIVQTAIFKERKGHRNYDFPALEAEESTSGRLRLSRRGSQLHYLFAEQDSPHFRLLSTEDVGRGPSRKNSLQLIVETHNDGHTSVVWKNITLRAESITGIALEPAFSIAQLNEQRDNLEMQVHHDFSQDNLLKSFQRLGSFWRFGRSEKGLEIDAPGSQEWKGTGLASLLRIEGDFDIALNLEVLHMEKAVQNQESTIYLQTEFPGGLNSSVDMKYSISSNGRKEIEMQLRRQKPDGKFAYEELSSRHAESVNQLRIARRDGIVYMIFKETEDEPAVIMSWAEVGNQPIPSTFLRAMVHTGGDNRKTIARFESLEIRAEKIVNTKR